VPSHSGASDSRTLFHGRFRPKRNEGHAEFAAFPKSRPRPGCLEARRGFGTEPATNAWIKEVGASALPFPRGGAILDVLEPGALNRCLKLEAEAAPPPRLRRRLPSSSAGLGAALWRYGRRTSPGQQIAAGPFARGFVDHPSPPVEILAPHACPRFGRQILPWAFGGPSVVALPGRLAVFLLTARRAA